MCKNLSCIAGSGFNWFSCLFSRLGCFQDLSVSQTRTLRYVFCILAFSVFFVDVHHARSFCCAFWIFERDSPFQCWVFTIRAPLCFCACFRFATWFIFLFEQIMRGHCGCSVVINWIALNHMPSWLLHDLLKFGSNYYMPIGCYIWFSMRRSTWAQW